MFVRIEGRRVETCPIAGTTRRTGDVMTDADSIRDLLSSAKEESELTMCTDVDRNDKSRICIPGSVQVIGRRLLESYAGVFHTVDHVVAGTLAPGFDSTRCVPLAHVGRHHSSERLSRNGPRKRSSKSRRTPAAGMAEPSA